MARRRRVGLALIGSKRPANTLARTTVPAALVDPAAGHPTLQRAGQHAVFATDEFFSACVVNPHTRRAYSRAVRRFLDWCELQNIDLARVTPGAAGRFMGASQGLFVELL